jgi:cytochrome c-type biogenesis protein CcsB
MGLSMGAQWSEWCVYAATATYVVAMGLFAATSKRPARTAAGRRRVLVGAGAAAEEIPVPAEKAVGTPADGRSWRERLARMAVAATAVGVVMHAVAMVGRWLDAGRAPWANMYEFAIAVAFVTAVAFLVVLRRFPEVRAIGMMVTGFIALVLSAALAYLQVGPAAPVVPALRSNWLLIHVFAAFVAGGVFTLAAMLSLAFMYLDRRERDGLAVTVAAGSVDRLARRLHDVAFPIWTFAVIAGAIWAEAAWGRYWGWDPKETSALVTWLLYAAYLHARSTRGWTARRIAKVAVLAWVSLILNFCWINLVVTGLHSYSGM